MRWMAKGVRFQTLLVEDDPILARAVERCLRARGADVVIAHTCERARSLDGSFDTAVLDIELPDGSGIDVAKHLLAERKTLAVVFFSGQDDPEVIRRAEQLGVFVHKSQGAGALLDALMVTVLQAAGTHATASTVPPRTVSTGVRRKVPH
jgi:DNA-binding response OmpR family regulator